MDPVKILPTEVFEKVLLYVDVHTLGACSLVSQKWNIAANNDVLWKKLCLENCWSDCGSLKSYVERLGFVPRDKRAAFHNMGEWKKHYVLRNQINNNWRLGNMRDYTLRPFDYRTSLVITCVFCDGHNLAFGFDNGLIKIFDLESETRGFFTEDCALPSSVERIKIAGRYVVVVQHAYLFVYKFDEDRTNLQLVSAKLISETSVINIDASMLLEIRRNVTTLAPYAVDQIDDIIFHIDENYLIFPSSDNSIDVYKFAGDMDEPYLRIKWSMTSADSRILCLRVMNHVVYFVVGNDTDVGEQTEKMHLHAFSVKSQSMEYVSFLVQDTSHPNRKLYSLEISEMYLVVRCYDYWTILVERQTGLLLLHDRCYMFLDANADPRMIGVTFDDSLQIMDPLIGNHYFCMSFMGLPIAMYSDIIVTLSVEFDRHGAGSTEVEFWNINTPDVEKADTLKFPHIPIVRLLYGDHTKLIFYCEQDSCVVRSFLI